MIPYSVLRPILFSKDPEKAHNMALLALEIRKVMRKAVCGGIRQPARICPKSVAGLDFPNPVGLAAGFDKDAAHVDALGILGFGFIEVGGITPLPQAGNPPPRIFRLPEAEALINRMGFNNCGAKQAAANLAGRKWTGVLGINIGKNAQTYQENAANDYCNVLEQTYPHGDFFTLNVSSPNTENLRKLQSKGNLEALIQAVSKKREELAKIHMRRAPLLIKYSPQLSDRNLRTVAQMAAEYGVDGAIAVNTTPARPEGTRNMPHGKEKGGLSGRPLFSRAVEVVGILRESLPAGAMLIGVGGIFSAADARAHFQAGADLVQVYTGLIYRGPNLVDKILRDFSANGI